MRKIQKMFFFEDLLKDSWISYNKTKSIWSSSLSVIKQFIAQHKLWTRQWCMANYLLSYFKVHLEGLSKLAQAQVLLQVNKRLLIHCMWESQQLPDGNQLLNFVFYMYLLILQGSQQWNISPFFGTSNRA